MNNLEKNNMNTLKDTKKLMSAALESNVKTPLEFAKVFKDNPPSSLTKKEVDTQVQGIKDFTEGKIDYAMMRSMCG